MAIWQFDAHLLPSREIEILGVEPTGAVTMDAFDDFEWWSTQQPPADLPERLTALFGAGPQATLIALSWGSDTGNRVDVIPGDDGWVEEIFVRFDARQVDGRIIQGIALMAEELGCMLRVSEDGSLLRADPRQILVALESSLAGRFVRDPEATLLSIRPNPDWWKE